MIAAGYFRKRDLIRLLVRSFRSGIGDGLGSAEKPAPTSRLDRLENQQALEQLGLELESNRVSHPKGRSVEAGEKAKESNAG